MDAHNFDRWTMAFAQRPTRRSTVRLLAGGMLVAWLSRSGAAPARAAQPTDLDGDGLYDDDETNVYGTRPDAYDTDGDSFGDGLEVYNRDNGLSGPSDPLTPDVALTPGAPAPCPAGQNYCGGEGGGCFDLTSDPYHCGGCDYFCDNIVGPICVNGVCTADPAGPAPAPAPTCRGLGARCDSNAQCCNSTYTIFCCFNGTVLDTICTDTAPTGLACPGDPPVPIPGPCPAGQTDCGGTCVDTSAHAAHCGACFTSCPLGGICRGSVCVAG